MTPARALPPPLFAATPSRAPTLLLAGLAMVGVGLAAAAHPAPVVILGFAAGWTLWLAGAVMLPVALLVSPPALRLAALLSALLVTASGVLLTLRPTVGALTVVIVLVAALVTDGGVQLAMALRLRPLWAWRWVLGSALASLRGGGPDWPAGRRRKRRRSGPPARTGVRDHRDGPGRPGHNGASRVTGAASQTAEASLSARPSRRLQPSVIAVPRAAADPAEQDPRPNAPSADPEDSTVKRPHSVGSEDPAENRRRHARGYDQKHGQAGAFRGTT
ncbi:hypothetical protein [Phenylobacterium sp. J367]|uniref:hypothetical protein n=1 Tax=Phenylobacterium sp. J367 TaxID=2898435 RepID=UPI002151DADD|nr:hypothetical protein [Phenylobacterium sp. J367]MCR5879276.1 hypothetical protein [Phenylobacterium sp. J367]